MELPIYKMFSYHQLSVMGNLYYTNKATPFQRARYEQVRAGLLAELRTLRPETADSGTACYLHAAIDAVLAQERNEQQRLNDQARANMQTAHNQLKNWR